MSTPRTLSFFRLFLPSTINPHTGQIDFDRFLSTMAAQVSASHALKVEETERFLQQRYAPLRPKIMLAWQRIERYLHEDSRWQQYGVVREAVPLVVAVVEGREVDADRIAFDLARSGTADPILMVQRCAPAFAAISSDALEDELRAG